MPYTLTATRYTLMNIFNTLSGKKESLNFAPSSAKATAGKQWKLIRLFVCGPTVYNDSHIGHARTYIVFDAFVRYLRSQKMRVQYLQNITDIDDKIIARAKEERRPVADIAQKYRRSYEKDMRSLSIASVNTYAPATSYILQIVTQVKTLIEKGYAYKIEGDGYYYDIAKFSRYGRLARRTVLQAEDAVSRIDECSGKRNKGDFALWKFSKPGEPSWKSDLGLGRPGWHIEDTAITEAHFGAQYDIHGGAVDLKFPHHEAEIAQAEAASGKTPLAKIWMHTGFLTVRGEKMSKSLKNFMTIEEFLKRHSPQALRLLVLSHHYRSPVNYTEALADDYEKSWKSIVEIVAKLDMARRYRNIGRRTQTVSATNTLQAFHKALEDDFNTPKALATLFEFIRSIQPKVWDLGAKSAETAQGTLRSALKSLGFAVVLPKISTKISILARGREKARVHKQFIQADALRNEIHALGYEVEDTPFGPFLWPQNRA